MGRTLPYMLAASQQACLSDNMSFCCWILLAKVIYLVKLTVSTEVMTLFRLICVFVWFCALPRFSRLSSLIGSVRMISVILRDHIWWRMSWFISLLVCVNLYDVSGGFSKWTCWATAVPHPPLRPSPSTQGLPLFKKNWVLHSLLWCASSCRRVVFVIVYICELLCREQVGKYWRDLLRIRCTGARVQQQWTCYAVVQYSTRCHVWQQTSPCSAVA